MSRDSAATEACAPTGSEPARSAGTARPVVGSPPRAELAALADPIRWRVLQLLGGGERCVCDLEAATGLAQSRLSYHLGILREAELICGRREGRWSYYSLNREALTRVSDRLIELSTRSAGPSRVLGTSECAASG